MSKYEKYFIMGNDVVSCRNCDRTYKKNKNGSTTTYLRHLKDSHRDLYTEFTKAMDLRTEKDKIQRELDDKQSLKRHFPAVEKPVMQQSGPSKIARNDGLQTIEEAISLWPADSTKSVALDSAIIQMIASDILPLSVVDNPGFRQVMQIAAPKYHLHGRNYFAREMLPQHYDKMKNHVSSIMSEANSISITTDCWSDANNTHSVISATAHFLDHEMQPKFLVLAAEPIVGAHNSQNLSGLISKVLHDFNLPKEKVHMIIRDAAAAMIKTTKMLDIESMDCFAHRLQLAINEEIEKYLEQPIEHEDFSSFWSKHVNSVSFPVLKMMARKYHSAPSTSAESERLFSIAKLILNDLRKSLTSSNFSKLLFLHHNLLICGFKSYE